jgi:7-cyano-7-deazaguanine synthase
MKVITIVSGGLDSSVLVHFLAAKGYEQHILSFNYGQRHLKELQSATYLSAKLGLQHDVVNLSALKYLLAGSALTDNIEVPDGHYTAESMKITIVPNRNAIMLSIAYAVAVAEHAQYVAIGVHAGDHTVYPDCRPPFIDSFQKMEQWATEAGIMLLAPFLYQTKSYIVQEGDRLGVDFAATWSCYKGGELHCGSCATCVERSVSFRQAGVDDPTVYEDKEFALQYRD